MKFWILGVALAALAACGDAEDTPPPRDPAGVSAPVEPGEGIPFSSNDDDTAPDVAVSEPNSAEPNDTASTDDDAPAYWGVAPGEPLPLIWEDLMPLEAEEELLRQQAEFYATLEQRYAANMTTLAEAETFDAIAEGSELDFMPQLGTFDVVEDLDGQLIRIPGYVVPFEFDTDKRHAEFLFVPYMGACIHTPPPPPNQIIFVRADPAAEVKDIWTPYWLEGELTAEENRNDLGNAAYTLHLDTLDLYYAP